MDLDHSATNSETEAAIGKVTVFVSNVSFGASTNTLALLDSMGTTQGMWRTAQSVVYGDRGWNRLSDSRACSLLSYMVQS